MFAKKERGIGFTQIKIGIELLYTLNEKKRLIPFDSKFNSGVAYPPFIFREHSL